MPDFLNQEPIAPEPADAAPDKQDAWDAILDTVIDDATGEIQLVVADPTEDKAPEAQAEGQAPAGVVPPTEPPPLDKSYQEVRSWATRVSQENAEVKRKLAEIEERYSVADTSKDFDDFVGRFAAALPEDMSELVNDRRRFAGTVARAADVLADRKVRALRESVGSLQEGIVGIGKAVEFLAAAAPEVADLTPYVQQVANMYAQAKPGASVFNDYTYSDVITAARAIRDQSRQQPQTQPATTAPGQATTPPPAAQAPRDARPPVTPAQRAAASGGVAVTGDDARTLGRTLETGPKAFGNNVRSIIDDVMGEAIAAG